MEWAVYMMAAYGVAFVVMYKVPLWQSWHWRDLLECSFCLGLWVGAALWGLSWAATGSPVFAPVTGGFTAYGLSGGVWALACGTASLILDGGRGPDD